MAHDGIDPSHRLQLTYPSSLDPLDKKISKVKSSDGTTGFVPVILQAESIDRDPALLSSTKLWSTIPLSILYYAQLCVNVMKVLTFIM